MSKSITIKWQEGGSITFDNHEGDKTMYQCAMGTILYQISKGFVESKRSTFTITTENGEDEEK